MTKKVSQSDENFFSHSLFKDDVLISKVLIEYQNNSETNNLINTLNNLDFNIVLLTTDNEMFAQQKKGFDKYYCNLPVSEQAEIAALLNVKAPTVYFGDKPTIAEKVSFSVSDCQAGLTFLNGIREMDLICPR